MSAYHNINYMPLYIGESYVLDNSFKWKLTDEALTLNFNTTKFTVINKLTGAVLHTNTQSSIVNAEGELVLPVSSGEVKAIAEFGTGHQFRFRVVMFDFNTPDQTTRVASGVLEIRL